MAGDKGENVLNMSQSELKLIALGCRFSEGGKVSHYHHRHQNPHSHHFNPYDSPNSHYFLFAAGL
jgi:hypothetical protein